MSGLGLLFAAFAASYPPKRLLRSSTEPGPQNQTPCRLEELPLELIELILNNCNLHDLKTLRRTDHGLRTIIDAWKPWNRIQALASDPMLHERMCFFAAERDLMRWKIEIEMDLDKGTQTFNHEAFDSGSKIRDVFLGTLMEENVAALFGKGRLDLVNRMIELYEENGKDDEFIVALVLAERALRFDNRCKTCEESGGWRICQLDH